VTIQVPAGIQSALQPASWQQELATFRSILTSFPVLCWLFY